jgi:site-specific DNA-methyltransferase (adenine-specific)
LKEGGSLFVYNIPKWNIQTAHFLSKRLEFRHWVTVDYKAAMPIPGKLYPSHYSLLYFTKGKPKKFNRPKLPIVNCRKCGTSIKDYGGYKKLIELNGGVNLSDVWTDISPVRHAKYKNRQCNELPEKIIERVLSISTEPHDVVLDPFGGSGTTYAVAEKMDRKWVGCEVEDCGYIIRRLSRLSENKNEIDKFATNFGSNVPEPGYIASGGWSR